jgi:hypothetical protein
MVAADMVITNSPAAPATRPIAPTLLIWLSSSAGEIRERTDDMEGLPRRGKHGVNCRPRLVVQPVRLFAQSECRFARAGARVAKATGALRIPPGMTRAAKRNAAAVAWKASSWMGLQENPRSLRRGAGS